MNVAEQKKLIYETSRLITAINTHLRMPTNRTLDQLRESRTVVSKLLVDQSIVLAHSAAQAEKGSNGTANRVL